MTTPARDGAYFQNGPHDGERHQLGQVPRTYLFPVLRPFWSLREAAAADALYSFTAYDVDEYEYLGTVDLYRYKGRVPG